MLWVHESSYIYNLHDMTDASGSDFSKKNDTTVSLNLVMCSTNIYILLIIEISVC